MKKGVYAPTCAHQNKGIQTQTQTDSWVHYLCPLWADTLQWDTERLNRINQAVVKQSPGALNKLRWGCRRRFTARSTVGITSAEGWRQTQTFRLTLAPVIGCWQLNSRSPMTFLSSFSSWLRNFCTFVRIINEYHVSKGPQWREDSLSLFQSRGWCINRQRALA